MGGGRGGGRGQCRVSSRRKRRTRSPLQPPDSLFPALCLEPILMAINLTKTNNGVPHHPSCLKCPTCLLQISGHAFSSPVPLK